MSSEVSAVPQTIVGQWLLAAVVGRSDDRDRLLARLNGGASKKRWQKYDEPATVEVACQLAVRRLLPRDVSDAQISGLAADMQSKSSTTRVFDSGAVEMVIRAALGQNVPITDLDENTSFLLQMLAVGYAYFKLSMSDQAITDLIVDAEHLARNQGWCPPLANLPSGP